MTLLQDVKEDVHGIKEFFRKNIKRVLLAAILILVFYLLSRVSAIFVILLYIAIGAVSILPQLWTAYKIGIELYIFMTIISALQFGPLAGMIVGGASTAIGLFITYQIRPSNLFTIIYCIFLGFISASIPFSYFAVLGILATVFHDILSALITQFLEGIPFTVAISYYITHFFINATLFIIFGRVGITFLSQI